MGSQAAPPPPPWSAGESRSSWAAAAAAAAASASRSRQFWRNQGKAPASGASSIEHGGPGTGERVRMEAKLALGGSGAPAQAIL